ncbi:hypothetical protein AAVH_05668 [Aphelenchoides avenae]|nr:hypothetical protein AAVH_05668 [Aphelenchus avenae]
MQGGRVVREARTYINEDCVYLYQSTAATLGTLTEFELYGEASREAVTNVGNGDQAVPSTRFRERISAIAWLWIGLANGTRVKLAPLVECESGTKLLEFVRVALPRSLFPYKLTDVFIWNSQSDVFVDVALNADVEDMAVYQFHLVEKVPLPSDGIFQSPFRSPVLNTSGTQGSPGTHLASALEGTTVPTENADAEAPDEQGAAVEQKQHSTKAPNKANISPPGSTGAGSVPQADARLYQLVRAPSQLLPALE